LNRDTVNWNSRAHRHGFAGQRIQLRAEKQERQDASGADVGDWQTRLRQRRMMRMMMMMGTRSHLRRATQRRVLGLEFREATFVITTHDIYAIIPDNGGDDAIGRVYEWFLLRQADCHQCEYAVHPL